MQAIEFDLLIIHRVAEFEVDARHSEAPWQGKTQYYKAQTVHLPHSYLWNEYYLGFDNIHHLPDIVFDACAKKIMCRYRCYVMSCRSHVNAHNVLIERMNISLGRLILKLMQ